MGMKISIALEHLKHGLIDQEYPLTSNDKFAIYETLVDVAYKYQLMQADYETRLKADMVAMLTDLQLEIEELDPSGDEWSDSLDACSDIIQQKINELKGEHDPTPQI